MMMMAHRCSLHKVLLNSFLPSQRLMATSDMVPHTHTHTCRLTHARLSAFYLSNLHTQLADSSLAFSQQHNRVKESWGEKRKKKTRKKRENICCERMATVSRWAMRKQKSKTIDYRRHQIKRNENENENEKKRWVACIFMVNDNRWLCLNFSSTWIRFRSGREKTTDRHVRVRVSFTPPITTSRWQLLIAFSI